MKRPRTEEHEFERNRMQEEDAREVRKGNVEGKASVTGKGPKGKGKGTKGECHECGGDHYVRDCPVSKVKAKDGGRLTRRMYNRDIGALGILVSFPSSGPAGGLEQREVEKERAFLEAKATAT